ncbi:MULTISPECIES: STAS domain-containing protein [Halalkalibacter]|uniref:Anti-sigma factor antagonist n=1 Tax=Halalkalibacter hemicellulosilyticusJCM 9152 TaxID=1236971 RepID=W4QAA8_9BACI|nr:MULTISPECIES: STAS domain-containing protein [Halalkalibacter]MCK0473869.1 STAS domain-containing protein [Halalkalibacter sp. APA_J-10(15)]GAE28902.1 anti-sigma F factor antagonist [Halalkalibacter hemicellulosilyticusJCM 9152]
MNLSVRFEKKENEHNVFLTGEIDAYTAPKLKESLAPLAQYHDQDIIIDLSDVEYIDSTGLGIFIGVFKAMHNHNGHLKLVGLSERIHRLFSITGLDEVMTIEKKERV